MPEELMKECLTAALNKDNKDNKCIDIFLFWLFYVEISSTMNVEDYVMIATILHELIKLKY